MIDLCVISETSFLPEFVIDMIYKSSLQLQSILVCLLQNTQVGNTDIRSTPIVCTLIQFYYEFLYIIEV